MSITIQISALLCLWLFVDFLRLLWTSWWWRFLWRDGRFRFSSERRTIITSVVPNECQRRAVGSLVMPIGILIVILPDSATCRVVRIEMHDLQNGAHYLLISPDLSRHNKSPNEPYCGRDWMNVWGLNHTANLIKWILLALVLVPLIVQGSILSNFASLNQNERTEKEASQYEQDWIEKRTWEHAPQQQNNKKKKSPLELGRLWVFFSLRQVL